MPTVSIHVSDEVFREIEAVAGELDRSRSWVVGDALEPYLEHRRWVAALTQKAMEDIESGRVRPIPHDDAVAEIMAYAATKR